MPRRRVAGAAQKRQLGRLLQNRRFYLKHHGLLVLRLPAPPVCTYGNFEWLKQPAQPLLSSDEVCWHFDGSMLNGTWRPFRATGFGIVVTSADGHLLAYGRGQPPHWCRTAAAAEAWALCSVVTQAPFLPAIRTDCMSLITTAASGIARATEPRKLLGRIWVLIGTALDGDLQKLTDGSTLVWVPAHTSPMSIGEAKRSDGARLNHIDWRANRLADGLAKQAAAASQLPLAVLRLLDSARAAVKHAAKLLGRVTFSANNHTVEVTADDGTTTSCTKRDAVDKPRLKEVPKEPCTRPPPLPPAPRQERPVRPWTPAQPATRRQTTSSSTHARRAAAAEQAFLGRVQEVGDALRPSSARPASERLDALRRRVLQPASEQP